VKSGVVEGVIYKVDLGTILGQKWGGFRGSFGGGGVVEG